MTLSRFILRAGLCACLWAALPLFAAPNYTGTNVTGKLILVRAINMTQLAQPLTVIVPQELPVSADVETLPDFITDYRFNPSFNPAFHSRLHPDIASRRAGAPSGPDSVESMALASSVRRFNTLSMTVTPGFTGSGFNGLTHADQRNSNGGNQFNIEPPSPSIAVGNGFVLEGVNNAIQVYTQSGSPLLAQPLASNQVFGLLPGINRTTNVRGPRLTDMRVFYDQGIDRWFVLQRSLDSDSSGNPLNTSHLYIAVSQTSDPTGIYNIYIMDTTNASNRGCPCLLDYPQIGADQYGVYVSANEYSTMYSSFVDAAIIAISKTSLASGATTPTAYQTVVHQSTGYDFTIQPAITPPGASYFIGANGLEYFVSSINGNSGSAASSGNTLALWAMTNTASLQTASPLLALSQIIVPTLTYVVPDTASQRPGPLPYGATLFPPGRLAFLDGGDGRVLSVAYSGGRLYATLSTQVVDDNGHSVVGGAYFVFSPTFRNGALSAFALRQGYLMVNNNHLLRPSIAINPSGKGAVVFTLVGPDYYPSAAFIPITTLSTPSTVQIAAPGVSPEDGFTGYPGGFSTGIARWGDYSTAVAASDGSIWMATEYIPNAPRTQIANWGTFLIQYTF